MEDWQQRVVDELTQVEDRWTRLNAFIQTPPQFEAQSEQEQERLLRQERIMKDYIEVLRERIEAWG